MMIEVTPAAVRLMLHRCGLSQTDAALFLDVQDRTVRRWVEGSRAPKGEQWQQLVELCARQDRAADEELARLRVQGRPTEVSVRLARTQADAERLGWPSPGAHLAVIRRVVERAPKGLHVVPIWPGEAEAADAAAARRTAH